MSNETCLILLSSDQHLDELLINDQKIPKPGNSEKIISHSIQDLHTFDGSFDKIYTIEQKFTDEQLQKIFKILNPKSILYIKRTNKVSNLSFILKSNGFVIEKNNDNQELIVAQKPEYEVASAVKIDAKKIWSLAAEDITEGDLIDDDALLDEQDRVKPKAEDLKVCATTKQRKACANCTCGLKEELEKEEMEKIRANTQNVISSCGNCYLGDAFRCESCPYRGLPAFKPGEKVVINNTDDL